jgi:hypothetical protein
MSMDPANAFGGLNYGRQVTTIDRCVNIRSQTRAQWITFGNVDEHRHAPDNSVGYSGGR